MLPDRSPSAVSLLPIVAVRRAVLRGVKPPVPEQDDRAAPCRDSSRCSRRSPSRPLRLRKRTGRSNHAMRRCWRGRDRDRARRWSPGGGGPVDGPLPNGLSAAGSSGAAPARLGAGQLRDLRQRVAVRAPHDERPAKHRPRPGGPELLAAVPPADDLAVAVSRAVQRAPRAPISRSVSWRDCSPSSAVAWLVAAHWTDVQQRPRTRQTRIRPAVGTGRGGQRGARRDPAALLAGTRRSGPRWPGFSPVRGTGQHDLFSRDGVGDRDQLVAGSERIQSFSPRSTSAVRL